MLWEHETGEVLLAQNEERQECPQNLLTFAKIRRVFFFSDGASSLQGLWVLWALQRGLCIELTSWNARDFAPHGRKAVKLEPQRLDSGVGASLKQMIIARAGGRY